MFVYVSVVSIHSVELLWFWMNNLNFPRREMKMMMEKFEMKKKS